jgi:dTDP-4-dehydrorhamnose reductase
VVPKASPPAARLAVLGGSGFLGAWLVELAQRNPSLAVASVSRDPAWFPRPRAAERFERMEVDALERDELETALSGWKPTHIVLCAALSRMADCSGDPERAHRMNVDLPHRTALWSRDRARMVYVSTDLVFGATPPGPRGFDELATPAPLSDYGRSKLGGESVLRVHARLDPRHLIVRLPLLYGPSFGRELGASDSLFAALERGETPRLFSDERRTPLDVRDAAAALLELALGDHVGLLHVGGPVAIDRYSFGMSALLERGFSAEKARASLSAGLRSDAGLERERPADAALDSTRARAVLRTKLRGPSEALADRGD